jgi:hypothetical protein
MGKRRSRESLSPEAFERALEEEMSLSAKFDLPLTLLVVRTEDWSDPETTRRLFEVFRTAEFVTRPNPSELAVILPNTDSDGARADERCVRKVLPDADVGLATRVWDDEASDPLERARGAGSL